MGKYKTSRNKAIFDGMFPQPIPQPENGGETNLEGENDAKCVKMTEKTDNPKWITAITPNKKESLPMKKILGKRAKMGKHSLLSTKYGKGLAILIKFETK